jgi:hypothetical protein
MAVAIGFAPHGRAEVGELQHSIAAHHQVSPEIRKVSLAERHSGLSHLWVRMARRVHRARPRVREGTPVAVVPCAGQASGSERARGIEANPFGGGIGSLLASGAALAAALARIRGWS